MNKNNVSSLLQKFHKRSQTGPKNEPSTIQYILGGVGNSHIFVDFFRRNNVIQELDGPTSLVLIPTDAAVKHKLTDIGITLGQLQHSQFYLEIMSNHLSEDYGLDFLDGQRVVLYVSKSELEFEDIRVGKLYGKCDQNTYKDAIVFYESLEFVITEDQINSVRDEYPYLESSTLQDKNFNLLDKNAIFQILVKLEPVDVISTCITNAKFKNICGDEQLFEQLFEAHYSDYEIQHDSAIKTYKSIVFGSYEYYCVVEIGDISDGVVITQFKTQLDVRNSLVEFLNINILDDDSVKNVVIEQFGQLIYNVLAREEYEEENEITLDDTDFYTMPFEEFVHRMLIIGKELRNEHETAPQALVRGINYS